MIVLMMGVAGAGKSTVGARLAERLGLALVDADELHAPEAIARMAAGHGLTEADRTPWLARVRAAVERSAAEHPGGVVGACSALTEQARRRLLRDLDEVHVVWLHGPSELLDHRLRRRRGHLVGVDLLPSQLATLEAPSDALAVDVRRSVDDIVDELVRRLG